MFKILFNCNSFLSALPIFTSYSVILSDGPCQNKSEYDEIVSLSYFVWISLKCGDFLGTHCEMRKVSIYLKAIKIAVILHCLLPP